VALAEKTGHFQEVGFAQVNGCLAMRAGLIPVKILYWELDVTPQAEDHLQPFPAAASCS